MEIVDFVVRLSESPDYLPLRTLVSALGFIGPAVLAAGRVGLYLTRRREIRRIEIADSARTFAQHEIDGAIDNYVEPAFSLSPPKDDDLFQRDDSQPAFKVLKEFVRNSSGPRHLLIIADAGVGKTTLLLNLVARPERLGNDVKVVLLPLKSNDLAQQIGRIPLPSQTVLLLDAFDEQYDRELGSVKIGGLQPVLERAAGFRRVIVTCRSTLFASDTEVPTDTGLTGSGPRPAGDSGTLKFLRWYLMPFDDARVKKYLQLRIPFWCLGRRRRVMQHVQRLSPLMRRPMLLKLVHELRDDWQGGNEIYPLFEHVVNGWFVRESAWFKNQFLERASRIMAVHIYSQRDRRRKDSISAGEIDDLIESSGLLDAGSSDLSQGARRAEQWKFKTRSLMVRARGATGYVDAEYKFSHQAILEFFVVQALIAGDARVQLCSFTPLMKEFFVSWLRTAEADAQEASLRAIRELDLAKTGLFPFATVQRSDVDQASEGELVFVGTNDKVGSQLDASFMQRTDVKILLHDVEQGRLFKVHDLMSDMVIIVPMIESDSDLGQILDLRCTREALSAGFPSGLQVPDAFTLRRALRVIDSTIGLSRAFGRRNMYWCRHRTMGYAIFRVSSAQSVPPALADDLDRLGSFTFRGRSGNHVVETFKVWNIYQAAWVINTQERGLGLHAPLDRTATDWASGHVGALTGRSEDELSVCGISFESTLGPSLTTRSRLLDEGSRRSVV
ncbi:NACHT domain-containing protein [Leptothrix discophora]|uniref:NACHT domain-containing protein n=1 Tax=Leptothrix discophora TaxID=89 RepID=A0ABT9G513_LEPDI|nr:hypothetical protein [Leptothrix discophora]MDP4301580.1 hypothetical protein [Leptothrix discophora]